MSLEIPRASAAVSALKMFAFLRHIHVKYRIKKDMIKALIKEMRV